MAQLNAYLTFNGNCEEAMNFYAKCLNGEIVATNRFSEMPEVPAGSENNIMHMELRAGEMTLFAADNMPGQPAPTAGTNITLSIMTTNIEEQTTMFNNLAEGGHIIMPLENTFWGARFGMLVDKYGFNWMTNCQLPQEG